MKETKPTANAARTVVSTPALIGRRPRARRRAGARRRGRARRVGRRAGRRRGRARRQRRAVTTTSASARERGEHGHEPGGQRRSRRPRLGEHARAVLRDERGLDLLLGLAPGDQLRDERRAPGRPRRRWRRSAPSRIPGTSPRPRCRAARRAARRRRPRRRERARAQQRGEQRAHHAGSSSSGGSVSSSQSCVTGKRRTAATLPVAVDHVVLRVAGLAPLAHEVAVAVAQVREGEPELVDRRRARRRSSP